MIAICYRGTRSLYRDGRGRVRDSMMIMAWGKLKYFSYLEMLILAS